MLADQSVPWDRRFWQANGVEHGVTIAAWMTVRDMVPDAPGGYVVVREADGAPAWEPGFTSVPAKAAPYPPLALATKWAESHSPTLYIGQGGHLRQRLDQLMRQPDAMRCGLAGNHRGGRALWQATDWPTFWLGWLVCESHADAQAWERDHLTQFQTVHGVLPVANWR